MDWYVDAGVDGAMTDLRHDIASYLARHADDTTTLDEAELVVAEVVGNAVRHAGGPVWVSMSWREVYPRLTVRDLGPGFDPATLTRGHAEAELAHAAGPEDEGGRGFFLISALAHDVLAVNRQERGALISMLLPVKRTPSLSQDPPYRSIDPLPAMAEAQPEGGFDRESFLRALVVQLARAVDYQHGPDAADSAVAQVGLDVGGQMENEYRAAFAVIDAMDPEQMAHCYVRLKHAIDGGFSVEEANEHRIVLTNTRCPFGDVVTMAPSLCRMTSSVFGGIAARNAGHEVAVLLEERIAVGDPGCRVIVAFDDSSGLDDATAHLYRPPTT